MLFKELLGNKCIVCEKNTDNQICENCLNNLTELPIKLPKIYKKFYFNNIFALTYYDGVIKQLIHYYKFENFRKLSHFFAELIEQKYNNILKNYDYFIFPPLHDKKLKIRGFNQAELILKNIDICKDKIFYELLKIKHTKQQSLLTKKERETNLNSSFIITQKGIELIKDKKILIFDDVLTTGTTLNEISKLFYYSNVKSIDVMVIATAK